MRSVEEVIASVIGSQDTLLVVDDIEGESAPMAYARAVVAALKAEGYSFWKQLDEAGEDW